MNFSQGAGGPLFCYCDLELDPMTFISELDLDMVLIYHCAKQSLYSICFKVTARTDTVKHRHDKNIISHHTWAVITATTTAAIIVMNMTMTTVMTTIIMIILITTMMIIVTQPLYESRMNWIHDPAAPTSRRPNLEFTGTPAPAIAKEFPGALSTQPRQKKSWRRRRRKASRTANQNAARRSAAPVTPDDRWANRNSASQRATRPKSAANDPQEMRSTAVYSPPSFHSSHVSQPPIPAANENAGFPFDLDRCEFSGLYKPAQIDPRQDLTATPTKVNSSGFGLSSPAPKQPSTKPFSGLPSGHKVTSLFREAGEAHGERPGIVYPLLPRATRPDTRLLIDAATLPKSSALSRQARSPTVLDLEKEEPREKENQPPSQSRRQ